MNLSFARKFPANKKDLAGKQTLFVEKIWTGFPIPFENWDKDYEREYFNTFGNPHPVDGIAVKPKIHTIRRDKARRWSDQKYIHFSVWTKNPYHSKTFNFAPVVKCTGTERIRISYWKGSKKPIVIIDDYILNKKAIEQLAYNDGFESVEEFFKWFDSDFDGYIIHWTPFKYVMENIDVKSETISCSGMLNVDPICCCGKKEENCNFKKTGDCQ